MRKRPSPAPLAMRILALSPFLDTRIRLVNWAFYAGSPWSSSVQGGDILTPPSHFAILNPLTIF
jgi:hypothetical protein